MRAELTRFQSLCLSGVLALALGACQSDKILNPAAIEPETGSAANIESLTAVIAREPNNPEGYNVRGSAYGRAGMNREALADFSSAIQLDPNFSRAYANRALVHQRTGNTEQAFADFNRAVQADPNYAAAYV